MHKNISRRHLTRRRSRSLRHALVEGQAISKRNGRFEALEDRCLLAFSVTPAAVTSLIDQQLQTSSLLKDFYGLALDGKTTKFQSNNPSDETVVSLLKTAAPQLAPANETSDAVTGKIVFGVGVKGEIAIGAANLLTVELGSLAYGYNLTYDFAGALLGGESLAWTLSRSVQLSLPSVTLSAEYYVSLDSITDIPNSSDTIRVGISAALESSATPANAAQSELERLHSKTLFRYDASIDPTIDVTLQAETTMTVGEFLSPNYMNQPTLAQGLADLFIPFYGDTAWQRIISLSRPKQSVRCYPWEFY